MRHSAVNENEEKAFAFAGLAENFGKQISSGLLGMWMNLVESYSAEQVAAACAAVIRKYEYKTLPPFAVIQRELDELTGNTPAMLELQAAAEWTNLLAMLRVGVRYRKIQVHPTTEATVRVLGGWNAVCDWPEKSLDFKRNDFIHHWQELHGKADLLELGAEGMKAALTGSMQIDQGPRSIASGINGVLHNIAAPRVTAGTGVGEARG